MHYRTRNKYEWEYEINMRINNRGQSLVELAITLPILMVLAFSILGIGFYIYDMSIYTYAVNKALDKGIGIQASRDLTQADVDEMREDTLNYTNVRVFTDTPEIHVKNTINESKKQKKIIVSIESNYNFNISFVNDILGTEPKISANAVYVYKYD